MEDAEKAVLRSKPQHLNHCIILKKVNKYKQIKPLIWETRKAGVKKMGKLWRTEVNGIRRKKLNWIYIRSKEASGNVNQEKISKAQIYNMKNNGYNYIY